MENICERVEEREWKYIKDYIVLSSVNHNILQETSIYKEAMSNNQKP
jgi:hypothetical protein